MFNSPKKSFVVLTCALLVIFAAGSVGASIIPTPTFGAKYSDVSSSPNFFAGETGNVWGILALSGTYNLFDNNPENNNLSYPAFYQAGNDGFQYYGVYGGLTFEKQVGMTIYLQAAPDMTSYLNIYKVPNSVAGAYNAARIAGPGAGQGALGSFGTAIITGGTLFLSTTFSPGVLQNYDANADALTLEKIVLSTSTTGAAEGYLDVTGGSVASLISKDIFPIVPLYPGFEDFDGDLKIISDLTSPPGGVGYGWSTNSQDPVTGAAVPEPGTLLLVGAGLVGLAAYRRRASK